MPNHVTTVCAVTGSPAAVAAFVERHIVPSPSDPSNRHFDFATVIPRATILEQTESSARASLGLAALVGDVLAIDFRRLGYVPPALLAALEAAPDVRHAALVRDWLAEHDPVALEKGRTCAAAIAETGYADWYAWARAHWGTKWGAYDYAERERAPGRFVFVFRTAWAFPEPVFRRLAELHPACVFAILAHDEGCSFGCAGELNGANDFRTDDALGDDAAHRERVYTRGDASEGPRGPS